MTERKGYFAEQNARAMAHAIINNPEIHSVVKAYDYFCMCINEKSSFSTKPNMMIFKRNGVEVVVQEDEMKLDPLVEVVERIILELYYSKQA